MRAKIGLLVLSIFSWVLITHHPANAQITTLYQSVEQALDYSPHLKAQAYNVDAVAYDLKRSRANYYPSLDVLFGYGMENHSDSSTRLSDADPSDSDIYSRGDATLVLSQLLYDGSETRNKVAAQQAQLDSANLVSRGTTQAVTLNAVSAHLNVYMHQKIVALAVKDLKVHEDIFQALTEIEQAGAGNPADVTQTQSRMARAQSELIVSRAELRRAVSNYERLVGQQPGVLAFAAIPGKLPGSLDEALEWVEQDNPELLSYDARVREADARVALARSNYKPKINIELSSSYHDHLEGDPSWQNTNNAMVVLDWNLFNGGGDKHATSAALARKHESRSNREDKLIELQEMTADAWTTHLALQSRIKAYRAAVDSSEKTFDAYLKQFSVSRRSLVDVLNAEREYFQSARQLVSVSVNEVIAACRILALGAKLQVEESHFIPDDPFDIDELAQVIVFPSASKSTFPEFRSPSSIASEKSQEASALTAAESSGSGDIGELVSAADDSIFTVEIGPFVKSDYLRKVDEKLAQAGFTTQQSMGTGPVEVIRLLEGVYSYKKAFQRFKEVQKISYGVFVMPEGKQLALYMASLFDPDTADRYVKLLKEKNIVVAPVTAEIELQGTMLIVEHLEQQSVEAITELLYGQGVPMKVTNSIPKALKP